MLLAQHDSHIYTNKHVRIRHAWQPCFESYQCWTRRTWILQHITTAMTLNGTVLLGRYEYSYSVAQCCLADINIHIILSPCYMLTFLQRQSTQLCHVTFLLTYLLPLPHCFMHRKHRWLGHALRHENFCDDMGKATRGRKRMESLHDTMKERDYGQLKDLTLSTPAVPNCYCLKRSAPYWSNTPVLIFDILALWRSILSARVPECQKSKLVA